MQALFYFHSLFVVEFDYIRLLGIKQLSLSIGIGSSHIQMIPPFPRFRKALSNTLYFLISRRSGAALFFDLQRMNDIVFFNKHINFFCVGISEVGDVYL